MENEILYNESDFLNLENEILYNESDFLDLENEILSNESDFLYLGNEILYNESDFLDLGNEILSNESDFLDLGNEILYNESDFLYLGNEILYNELCFYFCKIPSSFPFELVNLQQRHIGMDIWDKKKRSAVMARIKSKDTKPELIVRRYLYHRGYRYRKNVKKLPGTPDIVLRKYGIVIFIHGCFWHGHEADGHIPHSNTDFWKKKIERNKQRDERDKAKLKKMGWRVMTIWECQLKPAVREQTLQEMEYHINHTYLEHFKPKPLKTYGIEENSPSLAAEGEAGYGELKAFDIIEKSDE